MTNNKDRFSLIIDSKLSYLPTGMLREPYEQTICKEGRFCNTFAAM